MLKFPEADREESRSEQKQLAFNGRKRRLVCVSEQAGKQDGRLYLATYPSYG